MDLHLQTTCLLLPILALLCSRLCDACSVPVGYKPPTITQKVLRAPIIVYGRVVRTYEDPHYSFSPDTLSEVYTAQMEIYCTIKGPRFTQIFNISQAGNVPGHCSRTLLTPGQEYFVLLNAAFRPHGLDFTEIDKANMSEVVKACGLNPLYPYGVDERSQTGPCLEVAPPGECVSETEVHYNGHRSLENGIYNESALPLAIDGAMDYCGHQSTTVLLTLSLLTLIFNEWIS